MADHTHGEMDSEPQQKTFDGFMRFTSWAVIVILATIVFMAIFIT